ncbi:hypothetical protein V6N13_135391 [Hibiscus sabdariffa]|uniref:RNase H type-1 domain-containing protein n=1 Tax=Hibiscus sabdariffa TaxID=183260 RepID=A0ABR2R772_9ROSI
MLLILLVFLGSSCVDVLRIGFRRHQELLKICCDASFDLSSKRTGIAAVFRGCSRNIVGGVNECVMAASACTVEAMASRLGGFGFNQVILESDNIDLIRRLNGNTQNCWKIITVECDLLSDVVSFSSCSFSYIHRNYNKIADWVARKIRLYECLISNP